MKTYTTADLVSFGNYLLSEDRKNNFIDPGDNFEERIKHVHDADIANWEFKEFPASVLASLHNCPFKYCDKNPVCVDKCRNAD